MRKRKILTFAAMLLVLAGVATMLWLWERNAPRAARLLPEADAVVYLDLARARGVGFLKDLPQVNRDPDYEQFVRESGFEFERDLDEAAFAVHLPHSDGGKRRYLETRFSEVFTGRFDSEKLKTYFRRVAKNVEHYDGNEIFVLPMEGRTVRVAIISRDEVAVSNLEDPDTLRGIVQRAHEPGFALRGPDLVRDYYRRTPRGSLAWAIGKAWQREAGAGLALLGGLELSLPTGSVWVASAAYAGDVRLMAEAFLPRQEDAEQMVKNLNLFLAMYRSVQANFGTRGSDDDMKKLFDSLEVRQEENRAIISGSVSTQFLKKMVSQPPPAVAPEAQPAKSSAHPGSGRSSAERK